MAIVIKSQIEIVGPAHVSVITIGEDGREQRRSIVPATWSDGGWVDTKIGKEPKRVQDACRAAWTDDAVAEFKAPMEATMGRRAEEFAAEAARLAEADALFEDRVASAVAKALAAQAADLPENFPPQ